MKRTCALNKVLNHGDAGILFNGLTGAVMRTSKEFLTSYRLAHKNQPLDQAMIEALFPSQDIRETLEQEHILVPIEFNEYAFIDKARGVMVDQDLGTNVEFIVSYRCNFRCVYCYAGQSPPHMSEEMALKSADFAAEMAKTRNSRAIKVQFIGGEPLLNTHAIEIICNRMLSIREKENLIMRTAITTNGSLLTPKILQTIRLVGPVDVQITLDGPEPIHNKRRPMINGNSYHSVVKNLQECAEYIDNLTLRINVDYENEEYIPELLNDMRELVPDNTALTMIPTFSHTDSSATYAGQCFKSKDLSPRLTKLWKVALSLGFPPSWNPMPTFMSCGAVMAGSIAIDPSGDIYKCAATYGDKSMRVGTVEKGLETSQDSVYDQFVNRDKRILGSGQCQGCSALPICMGGCSFKSLRNHGIMHKPDCRFDQRECLDDFVRQYFKWHLHKRLSGHIE